MPRGSRSDRPKPDGHREFPEATELIARDRRDREIARLSLDLPSLLADAESRASATSQDPVRLLVIEIENQLTDAGAALPDEERSRLEAALTRAIIADEWPETTEVRARASASRGDRPAGPPPRLPTPPSAVPPASPTMNASTDLFEKDTHYPSPEAQRVFESLVGLNEVKERLVKEAIVLTQPTRLRLWSEQHHAGRALRALAAVRFGTPLLLFAGDVGTGKSALAESFGDAVARQLCQTVRLLRMSIQARGSGIVGDMTRQISRAFRTAESEARRTGHVTILLLDEADALAESRETQQMHHEDRAGVNALIQGIDHLRGANVPVLVVFCTNRVKQIDPALRRRAVDIVEFRRPDDAQRRVHLERLVGDLALNERQWSRLVELTGPREGRTYGFSYSDIADRLVRNAILAAFPDRELTFDVLERIALEMTPTRPFGDQEG